MMRKNVSLLYFFREELEGIIKFAKKIKELQNLTLGSKLPIICLLLIMIEILNKYSHLRSPAILHCT